MRNSLLHLIGAALTMAISIIVSCHWSAHENLNQMVAANHDCCMTQKEPKDFSNEPCKQYTAIVIPPPKTTNSVVIPPPENSRAVVINPCEDSKGPVIKLEEQREHRHAQKPDIQIEPSASVISLND